MKEINLTQGKVALVDDEDFDILSKYSWRLSSDNYAMSQSPVVNGKQPCIMMHRFINKTPKGLHTDHINHNKLDNRKSNLRTVTPSLNQQNSVQILKYSLHGIYTDKRDGLWRARIKIKGVSRNLGSFKTKEEAHLEYQKFSDVRYHSKFIIIGGCCNE